MPTRRPHHTTSGVRLTSAVGFLLLLAARTAPAQTGPDSSHPIRPWAAGSVVVGSSGAESSGGSVGVGAEASAGFVTRWGWGVAARILQSETPLISIDRPGWRVRTITGSVTYRPAIAPLLHLRAGLGATDGNDGVGGDHASAPSLEAGAEIDTHSNSPVELRLYILTLSPLSSPRVTHGGTGFVQTPTSQFGNFHQLYVGAGLLVQ